MSFQRTLETIIQRHKEGPPAPDVVRFTIVLSFPEKVPNVGDLCVADGGFTLEFMHDVGANDFNATIADMVREAVSKWETAKANEQQ